MRQEHAGAAVHPRRSGDGADGERHRHAAAPHQRRVARGARRLREVRGAGRDGGLQHPAGERARAQDAADLLHDGRADAHDDGRPGPHRHHAHRGGRGARARPVLRLPADHHARPAAAPARPARRHHVRDAAAGPLHPLLWRGAQPAHPRLHPPRARAVPRGRPRDDRLPGRHRPGRRCGGGGGGARRPEAARRRHRDAGRVGAQGPPRRR
mmetsp:Transcript_24228/g.84124  ORF Transcript_24228/g.84124 Transcript_24228/m.84124 type:complete len:211 (+) Transcript_24228:673-1305(+)